MLLKLTTTSFRERGADLTFLSAFPGEKEILYPPLTHLKPAGPVQEVTLAGGGSGKKFFGLGVKGAASGKASAKLRSGKAEEQGDAKFLVVPVRPSFG